METPHPFPQNLETEKYFPKNTTGPNGGMVKQAGKSKPAPKIAEIRAADPALAADLDRDERHQRLEASRMENPLVAAMKDEKMMTDLKDDLEAFLNLDFEEINPEPGVRPLNQTLVNFFLGVRPSVIGPASGLRNDYMIRICTIPWYPVECNSASQRVALANKKGGIFSTSATAVNDSPRETFPSQFHTLSDFLTKYRPISGVDISLLEQVSEADRGHENETAPLPEKLPTLTDLIAAMTSALKNQQPAKP